jgi:hypothetical protein
MDSIEALLTAWRDAEAAVDAAEPATTTWRRARLRADFAKTAYLTAVGDVFDTEGHSVQDAGPADDASGSGDPEESEPR